MMIMKNIRDEKVVGNKKITNQEDMLRCSNVFSINMSVGAKSMIQFHFLACPIDSDHSNWSESDYNLLQCLHSIWM